MIFILFNFSKKSFLVGENLIKSSGKSIEHINEVKAIDDIGKENIKNIRMMENDINNTRNF